jgi:hypothetical protein
VQNANYEIVDRRTMRRSFVFQADNSREASRKFEDWLQANGYPIDTEDYGFREIGSSAMHGSTPPRAQQQTPGGFTGQWRVIIDGEEVHRFGGVGNVQADANRVGQQWVLNAIRQGRLNPVPGAEIDVVPAMSGSGDNR